MKLVYNKKSNDPFYYIQEGFWVGNKVKMVTICKLATVNNLQKFFEKPEFTHQQVLRFMDVLSDNYDSYLEHLYTNSNNVVQRDTSVCY